MNFFKKILVQTVELEKFYVIEASIRAVENINHLYFIKKPVNESSSALELFMMLEVPKGLNLHIKDLNVPA